MAILHGRNLIIRISGTAIAGAKSCTIHIQCDNIETASATSGSWKTFLAGRKGAMITVSCLVIDSNFKSSMEMVGSIVSLSGEITGVSGSSFSCSALVQEWKVDASVGNLAQGSFGFLVSGSIT